MAGWSALTEELDRWRDAGMTATFWWRDDDAVDDTAELDVLLDRFGRLPIALAVIPGLATPKLAAKLAQYASVSVLQHGWRHANHATAGTSEYPAHRAVEDVSRELSEGRRILMALFGRQTMPVFAPPWHGFDARFLALLRPNGLIGISRKGPRPGRFATEGVVQANAHVAPIEWSNPPAFAGDELYLDQIIDHLRGRRLGRYDMTEATGLLTHHLAQNDASYSFIARLVGTVSEHAAGRWTKAKDLFSAQTVAEPMSSGPAGAGF